MGRPCLRGQLCELRSNLLLTALGSQVAAILNSMVALCPWFLGRATQPEVSSELTSAGHFPVSAHEEISSRKLLPKPLSPVIRLSSGATFSSMFASVTT